MMIKDLKYLTAYIIPLSGFYSIFADNWLSFTTLVIAFVILPTIETILPPNTHNLEDSEYKELESRSIFDIMLFLNLPLVIGLLYYYFISMPGFSSQANWIGSTLSVGLILSTAGINVAHELGHKAAQFDKAIAKMLLLPSLYMHFIIEHNYGHHVRVSTLEDPATSRKNENLYFFWVRSVVKGYLHSWEIENRRLTSVGKNKFSLSNQMIRFTFIQLAYLAIILLAFGPIAMVCAVIMAIFSFLMLETINYVEHYGLLRKKNASGKYERVNSTHSWNSDHVLGRIMLYELTRHSDHHYKANKKYQTLEHHEESPQLPFGYPGSMLISLIPPLWFKIMNPLVEKQVA